MSDIGDRNLENGQIIQEREWSLKTDKTGRMDYRPCEMMEQRHKGMKVHGL